MNKKRLEVTIQPIYGINYTRFQIVETICKKYNKTGSLSNPNLRVQVSFQLHFLDKQISQGREWC